MQQVYFYFLVLLISISVHGQFYGPEDFRISDAGGLGSTNANTNFPDLAYNKISQQYLVVWESDDTDQNGVIDNDTQIIGRFVDLNGNVQGNDFLISALNIGDGQLENEFPRVAYNSMDNNFMVVYEGEINNGENQIYGVLLDQNGSVLISDLNISNTGNSNVDARSPAIAYNPVLNEYLIIYVLIDQDPSSNDTSVEIYGQKINNVGAAIGSSFAITNSANGANTSSTFPDVIFNPDTNEFMITYQASPSTNQEESYSTVVSQSGTVGTTTQLSNRGSIDSNSFGNYYVRSAYSSIDDVYLFVYEADNTRDGEIDVFGVIYDNSMNIVVPEFEISKVGGNNVQYDAGTPHVAWLPSENAFYVVFRANPFFNNRNEREIFMRKVTTTGEVGDDLLQVSSAPIDDQGIAFLPRIASNSDGALLTVYRAGDTSSQSMMVVQEYEIFGQLYGTPTLSTEIEETIHLNIYPNPADDSIYLTGLTENLTEIRIINELGQIIQKVPMNFEITNKLSIVNLKPGIYFLEATTSMGSVVSKFVKM